jgi:hypothetical protein
MLSLLSSQSRKEIPHYSDSVRMSEPDLATSRRKKRCSAQAEAQPVVPYERPLWPYDD